MLIVLALPLDLVAAYYCLYLGRIIGDESGLGVIPQACKDGNMGNRNLYHFCLAMLIFLDIMVPLTLLAILFLTLNTKDKIGRAHV